MLYEQWHGFEYNGNIVINFTIISGNSFYVWQCLTGILVDNYVTGVEDWYSKILSKEKLSIFLAGIN